MDLDIHHLRNYFNPILTYASGVWGAKKFSFPEQGHKNVFWGPQICS